ncbi:MAG TPA: hypothetical protein ENI94_02370 [Gammaproteobacteria bacterium]|nr:hypothetical protein [Gammaproteobacteria bacterium]
MSAPGSHVFPDFHILAPSCAGRTRRAVKYRSLLESGVAQKGRATIEQALANAQRSLFVVFEPTLVWCNV